MSAELFLDAMGKINDTCLAEYADLKTAYLIRKRRQKRIFSSAAAACAGLLILAGAAVMIYSGQAKRQTAGRGQKPTQETVYVTEAPKERTTPTPVPTDSPAERSTPLPTQPPVSGNVPEIHTQPPALPETEAPLPATEVPPEKDWRSEWQYFITHQDSEQGHGLTRYPTAGEPSGAEVYPYLDEETFRQNSKWLFDLQYQGVTYVVKSSKLSKDDVGEYLQDLDLHVREINFKDYDFNVRVPIYRIAQIPADAAIAVSIGADSYCLFVNTAYAPATFREFVQDFHLMERTDFLEIAFYSSEQEEEQIEEADDALIRKLLWETDASLSKPDLYHVLPAVSISFSSDYYEFYNINLSIYNEGYMYFRVMGNGFWFRLDSQKVIQALKDHYN